MLDITHKKIFRIYNINLSFIDKQIASKQLGIYIIGKM